MKKKIQKEVVFCDSCGKEDPWGLITRCDACGKEYCMECRKENVVSYQHGVSCSGSGDGEFCRSCDNDPPLKFRPLLEAYRTIKTLREESNAYYDDFKKRQDNAEALVKTLRAKAGLK